MALTGGRLVGELQELIAALDRRVPRVGHVGEASIAQDAARLRAEAVRRIAELGGEGISDTTLPAGRSPGALSVPASDCAVCPGDP